MNPRITEVAYQPGYQLRLVFENGEKGIFSFQEYLKYPVYQPLADESYCKKAKVCNGTVIWDDVVDFDPDTLYLESKKERI